MTRSARSLFFVLLLAGGTGGAAGRQDPAAQWDRRYATEEYVYGTEPVAFLVEQIDRLPPGRALVLAAGEGRNAVYLAEKGWDVVAVDISAKGLDKCRALAARRGVRVETVVADLADYDMGRERWNVITDFYYHDPRLFPRVVEALAPGGMFIVQGFSIDQPKTNRFGPRDPAHLIKPNELLDAFRAWRIRHYEDTVVELDEGMHRGPGAVVRLLVEKTPVAP